VKTLIVEKEIVPSKPVNYNNLRLAIRLIRQIDHKNDKFTNVQSCLRRIIVQERFNLREIDLIKRLKLTHRKTNISYTVSTVSYQPNRFTSEMRDALTALREKIKEARQDAKSLSKTRRYVTAANDAIEMVGGVHLEKNTFVNLIKKRLAKLVYKDKTPKNKELNYVGLELEFCSPMGRDKLASMLLDANLTDDVTLKSDGSVRPHTDDHAYEICIIAEQSNVKNIVDKVVDVLGKAESYVNKTCGFHVHLDMRNRDKYKAFNNLMSVQGLLYRMNPKSRKDNRFCKPTRGKDFDKNSSGSRYKGVNVASIHKHGTIEVRIHSGTINSIKIINWVNLLLSVIDAPKIDSIVRSVRRLNKVTNLQNELSNYVSARIELFKNQHTGLDNTDVGYEESQAA
jgi:hypothetical protein